MIPVRGSFTRFFGWTRFIGAGIFGVELRWA